MCGRSAWSAFASFYSDKPVNFWRNAHYRRDVEADCAWTCINCLDIHGTSKQKQRCTLMAATAVGGTLTGCIGCMLSVEVLSRRSPDCMNLMTCSTFTFVSFIGLLRQSHFFKQLPRNKIPLFSGYMRIVLIFFVVNVSNNLALRYDVSIPLFIIFRSGTLLANILLGYFLRSRICSWKKLLSVISVTVGIILFTLADEFSKHPVVQTAGKSAHPFLVLQSSTGILLLLFAVFLSAYLGICQEDLYRTYGKHSEEAMFFVHALSLPGFLLLYDDIWQAAVHFNNSDAFVILGLQLPIPTLWMYMVLTCIFQWICITNVYTLTSVTTSLNVTMVITLRKFLSMVLSIMIFKNSFTVLHFVGSALVLLGTATFTLNDLKSETLSSARKKNL